MIWKRSCLVECTLAVTCLLGEVNIANEILRRLRIRRLEHRAKLHDCHFVATEAIVLRVSQPEPRAKQHLE